MHPQFACLTPHWFYRAYIYTGSIGDFRYRFDRDADANMLHTAVYSRLCYEVADDVLCYNAAASHGWWYWDPELGDYAYAVENQWFETLLEARTFSPTLTLYVDSTGGKVRVVSAQ